MPKTNYCATSILNTILRGQALAAPGTLSLALFTQSPTVTGDLTNEVVGGGYARVALQFNAPDATNTCANSLDTFFNMATTNWPQATHWGLVDATNNMWYFDVLENAKTAGIYDELKVAAGDITIQEV